MNHDKCTLFIRWNDQGHILSKLQTVDPVHEATVIVEGLQRIISTQAYLSNKYVVSVT